MNASFTAIVISLALCSARADMTNYQSPVDGKSYRADWHTYTPTNSTSTNKPAGRVQKQNIRLLATQEVFQKNVDVSGLAAYIQKMERGIDSSLGRTNDAFVLAVKTTLTKDKRPDFQMSSSGGVSNDLLQKIYDGLNQLPDFRSRSDEVAYEVRFTIAKAP